MVGHGRKISSDFWASRLLRCATNLLTVHERSTLLAQADEKFDDNESKFTQLCASVEAIDPRFLGHCTLPAAQKWGVLHEKSSFSGAAYKTRLRGSRNLAESRCVLRGGGEIGCAKLFCQPSYPARSPPAPLAQGERRENGAPLASLHFGPYHCYHVA
jgi:hypothetical protein